MAHALLPDPGTLALDTLAIVSGVVTFQVRTTSSEAACPECSARSARPHSKYVRTLKDLPWQGNAVAFQLTLRRFFCDNPQCKRRIFAESVKGVARRYQRKTLRLESVLRELLWNVGASAAARIAQLLGLLVSDDAMLYQFKRAAPSALEQTGPEVLGIDDFAFRKGRTYGTILIDLRTSTPVDLLPSRESASVEKWLKEHPGVRIVSRDRSPVYADAVRAGAPEAVHVADRFHLVKNLIEALEKQIGKESHPIREALLPKGAQQEDSGPIPLSRKQQHRKDLTRQKRFEKWQKAHELAAQGYFKKEIARMTGVNVRTIREYLRSSTFPERQRYPPMRSSLDPYKEHLQRRWSEGCHNALELFREAKARGFPGTATAVRDFVRPWRDPNLPPVVVEARRAVPTPRALAWMLLQAGRLTDAQRELVEKLCLAVPILPEYRDLVLSFQDIMRRRAASELDAWMDRAKALPGFASFVRGLRMDLSAVMAAFTLEWSNGPTEGHVNRLKFVKRQGYGRASFELLKRRVLPLPS